MTTMDDNDGVDSPTGIGVDGDWDWGRLLTPLWKKGTQEENDAPKSDTRLVRKERGGEGGLGAHLPGKGGAPGPPSPPPPLIGEKSDVWGVRASALPPLDFGHLPTSLQPPPSVLKRTNPSLRGRALGAAGGGVLQRARRRPLPTDEGANRNEGVHRPQPVGCTVHRHAVCSIRPKGIPPPF